MLGLVSIPACIGPSDQRLLPLTVTTTPPQSVGQTVRPEAIRRNTIGDLLASARLALANDRLMIPQSDSAYSWYQQVLSLDEHNGEAHRGMAQITARYLQLAEQAFVSGRVEKAERMLDGAERISATPAQTAVLRQRYRQRVAENETRLSIPELTLRSEKITAQLVALAGQAQAASSRLLIIARTDAEGRWIYQQMRAAVKGYRLRGNIELGRQPRVVLIDL